MNGRLVLVSGALALVGIAYYGGVAAVQEPADQKLFVAPGFSEEDAAWVKRTYEHVVKALDNIDLTKGISKETLPVGTVVVKEVEPSFGFGRTGVVLNHPGRFPESMDPTLSRLVGIGARGSALTKTNLRAYNTKGQEALAADVLQEVIERIETINKGGDVAAVISGQPVWIKPLKLTKSECLPCHADMKVGDTVGVIAFLAGLEQP